MLYKNYVDDISHYLKQKRNNTIQKNADYGNINERLSPKSNLRWLDRSKNEADFRSLASLNEISGTKAKYEEKLGAHPSFNHLKNSLSSENHYIVSMFIDVKNSTGLFKKYEPEIVANICRTIQLAAIHTCWHFDGYIQRLQGDGLMVYFGGKKIPKVTAVKNALTAASFVSYFVKNDLKNLFEEQGVNRIYTRIGIDLGDDKVTLWHNAGVGECSEVTTTSLHTSLACKLQTQAKSNGIVVGDNILTQLSNDEKTNFFEYMKYIKDGESKDYIYEIPEDGFKYKQHEFLWEKFLKNHRLLYEDSSGSLVFDGNLPTNNSYITPNIEFLERNVSNYKPYFQ